MNSIEKTPHDPALMHRRILCGFTLVMMGLSWPLWGQNPDLPKFPLFENDLQMDLEFEPLILATCIFGLLLSFSSRFGRIGSALALMAGLWLVANDQQRLQAWFYQTLILSCTYAILPGNIAIGFARLFAVALYTHSAISKLDWSFAHSMGPYLLNPILQLLPESVGQSARWYFIMALPVSEIIVAIFLVTGLWQLGLAGVLIMHTSLFVILGPWLLDHSANVLIWNISMGLQAIVLFRTPTLQPESNAAPYPIASGIIQLLFMAVCIMPFFERAGLWDPWPSFALYAGHVEQLRLDFPSQSRQDIPQEFQPFLLIQADRLYLDLTLWSRARLGVPPYPSSRIQKELAKYVAEKCPEELLIRATFLSKSHWRTGQRTEFQLTGREAILRLQ
jgi:hypothetical protein